MLKIKTEKERNQKVSINLFQFLPEVISPESPEFHEVKHLLSLQLNLLKEALPGQTSLSLSSLTSLCKCLSCCKEGRK